MKFPVNSLCPCGSNKKYKKCCQVYHKGAIPNKALDLMKSRYVAYKLGLSKYIISTTHKENKDYTDDINSWIKSIDDFSKSCQFSGLKIIEFIDGEAESFVTFYANINCNKSDNSFCEKSRFLKVDNRWLYHSGEFIQRGDK
jgi:SEC-C motif-containing protein